MLVLSRKTGEAIVIGDGIKVTVTRVSGNRVTIGIDAPGDVRVYGPVELEERVRESLGVRDRKARLPRSALVQKRRVAREHLVGGIASPDPQLLVPLGVPVESRP